MANKVLFLDSVHPVLEEQLSKDGFICEHDYTCSVKELIEKIHQYFGLVIRSRIVLTGEVLKHASELKFIARSGSGLENIDLKAAKNMGIQCFNSPEGNRDAVGEHALAMLLALFNHLSRGDAEVRKLIWKREENRGIELGGRTVGIIGYGNTGRAFAKKLSGFDCKVLAHDKYLTDYGNEFAKESSMKEVFEQCDVVSLHIPYNSENHYLASREFFSSFKKPFYFINTSRGKVLDTQALMDAMQAGRVLGACLDVLEYESHSFEGLSSTDIPPAMQYLINSENVILSPHVAGWTVESYFKLSQVLYEKIRSWLDEMD